MKPNHERSRTNAAILSASAIRRVLAADAPATAPPVPSLGQTAASAQALQAVVVIATRRRENVQDVPVTVQGLTGRQTPMRPRVIGAKFGYSF